MSRIDDLPFPIAATLALLVYVIVPLGVSVFGIRGVYRKTRGWTNVGARERWRAASIGFFAAPTLLIEAVPSVHGALVFPYFAWYGLARGLWERNGAGVGLAVVSVLVVSGIAWLVLRAIRVP